MKRKYPNLCKPIQIGRVTFRNRMFSAPMGGTDIQPMRSAVTEQSQVLSFLIPVCMQELI